MTYALSGRCVIGKDGYSYDRTEEVFPDMKGESQAPPDYPYGLLRRRVERI
jgi:hypothetical protein